jgi:hypothetical protein
MNEHSLTKLLLVTNMHLYINPKRGFLKILNFEQAHHFCSKQAVQKQWSLIRVKPSFFSAQEQGKRHSSEDIFEHI